jgi:hypothetical protein
MSTITYLLQVSACTGVFYAFYYLLLRRLTFFTINRWYLIMTLTLSFIVPVLTIPVKGQYLPSIRQAVYVDGQPETISLNPANTATKQLVEVQSVNTNWPQFLKLIYLMATVVLLGRLIYTIGKFFWNLKGKELTRLRNVKIIVGDKSFNNGSFLNYIFLNDDALSSTEINQIIEHELLHVKLYHSVDRLLIKFAQVALWFNPFVYLYARSVEENHEFEVDREMGESVNKTQYADLLLHLSIAGNGGLYHSFSKVPLKRRINMLFTKPTNRMKKTIYLLALPIVMLSCLAFARLKSDSPQQYSVIDGVDKLGKDIKVTIDGKLYNKDILYKISSSAIKNSVIPESRDPKLKGSGALEPSVIIETKKGKIVYMTSSEKENLIKERAIPAGKFYNRLRLTDNNGRNFDKIIIQLPTTNASAKLGVGEKAIFYIDGTSYTEKDMEDLSDEKIKSFSTDYTISSEVRPASLAKGFKAWFYFTTKKDLAVANLTADDRFSAINGVDKLGPKPLVLINDKEYDADILYTISPSCIAGFGISRDGTKNVKYAKYGDKAKDGVVDITVRKEITYITETEKENIIKERSIPASQFYTRLHLKENDGKSFDKVVIKLDKGSVTGDLAPSDKAIFFIDDKSYTEEEIKTISTDKIGELSGEYGVSTGIRSGEYGQGVTAVFRFKTKK